MAVDYPIGLNLGQYKLSSAYYNSRDELINVVTINSSQEWQDHYWETWKDRRKEQNYDAGAISIYSATLESIQTATETALSRPVEVRAVTAPAHFFEGQPIFNLRLAASSLHYFSEDDAPVQVVALYNAARLAYNLDNCKTLGAEEGCNLADEENFAFVLEFSPYYLNLKFLSIDDYYCAPEGKVEFPQYGEIGNSQHLKNPNSEYFQEVTSAIQVFMDEMIVKMTEHYGIKDSKLKVRGIILAGDVSSDGMESFKEIIKAALPEYEDHFIFNIDPSVIGAVGAAHRARQWALKNPFMKPRVPFHDDL